MAWLPAPTPEDAAAQRAARAVNPGGDRFAALDAFGAVSRRTTAAGREPFRLEPASPEFRPAVEVATIRVDQESAMSTLHEEAHKLVDQLPKEASWDDLMYQIYVRQKIEAGRRAIAEGRFATQEEAERRMAQWLAR